MSTTTELAIPTTSTSASSKPYTIYNIAIRQPVRSYTVQKRYSEFTDLHAALQAECSGATPPKPLPAKSWFKSTISSPELTEERRAGLESYLQAIATGQDGRWRNTNAWRSFLRLPQTNGKGVETTAQASAVRALDLQGAIIDPTIWLDTHRDLKTQLREARLHITRRDQAGTAQTQYEASAEAKSCLVRSGTILSSLERGLEYVSNAKKAGSDSQAGAMGDGELRRRRDLLSAAKKERHALESALSTFVARHGAKGSASGMATAADKDNLMRGANGSSPHTGRRVLGAPLKETDKTRELDNAGVLQLQKRIMQEQDADVTDLTTVVRRLKEMGVHINDELALQNQMLGMLDEDVDRVGDKINIAKKRIDKIK